MVVFKVLRRVFVPTPSSDFVRVHLTRTAGAVQLDLDVVPLLP